MTAVTTPPARRAFSSFWDFMVRGYRPLAAWVGLGTMLVHGMIIPLLPVFGRPVVGVDWMGVSTFLGVVFGPLVVARTVEKVRGVTS